MSRGLSPQPLDYLPPAPEYWVECTAKRPVKHQKAVPFGGAMVDRFKESIRQSPCARLCYNQTETTGDSGASSIRARLAMMQSSGRQGSSFASRLQRFKREEPVAENEIKLQPGFADAIVDNGKVVYTLRSKRRRFEWEKPAPKVVVSEIPDVILQKRKTKEPGENPFHRTVQGEINGHNCGQARNYAACAFKSKSALHPIHGFDLRQTLFATDNSSPITWMGAGAVGPGEYAIDDALDSLAKQSGAGDSMFKVKGCAGMPDIAEDWRTSPYRAEDWTAPKTFWSNERNRILSSPFKATDKRFKDIEPMNSATYKIPADNITNTNAKIITSMFKSTSPQISLLSKVPERSAEALDYEPRWDKINKNSPMKDTSGRMSPPFKNVVKRFGVVPGRD